MEYNLEEIKEKAEYCLNCKTKPCTTGCPLQNNIPDFINCIKEEKYEKAFEILSGTTVFEPICGRICPHKSQCEGKCVRGIKGESVKIGDLETFVGDYALKYINNNISQISNKKIAVIGSGPAGLACSYYLSQNGYKVALYEKHSKLGGLLRYGIPDFRLDKVLLDNWLEKFILNKNIQVYTNMELGKNLNLDELKEKNDVVILAFGANVSNKMGIEGEENIFVLGGNELLEYGKMPDFQGKKVAIVGGGNVAMDASRTIKKKGAEKVIIVYRRAEEQMPAERKEIEDAKKEGIEFLFQTNIINILNEENKRRLECVKTKLLESENGERKYPVNIDGSNFMMNVDYVVMALGSGPNKELLENVKLNLNKWGYIDVDENYKTSDKKVYAIGDIIGTKKTVAWAAKTGFDCAKNIININVADK